MSNVVPLHAALPDLSDAHLPRSPIITDELTAEQWWNSMTEAEVSQAIQTARLPVAYEAARTALAECDRIDECKTWADKAAAIASYALQAKDDNLAVYARRIQARAYRRLGELLKQCPSASEENLVQHRRAGSGPSGDSTGYAPVTRTQAAADAGLSERQRKTAQRVASMSAAAFDAQVDSPRPSSITQLARQGTARAARRDGERSSVTRVEHETPTALEAFERFIRFCENNEPICLARACTAQEATQLRHHISKLDRWFYRWLERFNANLPE